MCALSGIFNLNNDARPNIHRHLQVMNDLQAHRGPDGSSTWVHPKMFMGFGHCRLSIIDLRTGSQPMTSRSGNVICHNGEIYNYLELREELRSYPFQTTSDTEAILAAYSHWDMECLQHLRGMFSFALWDEKKQQLFCARDRFGIKPFYYTVVDGMFYFASEVKALLPFLHEIKINLDALKEYLVFQFYMDGKTLFQDIHELPPAHRLVIKNGKMTIRRYWEVYYNMDFDHTEKYFEEKLRFLLEDSVKMHLRSDVPVGAYLSGGMDSSIICALAAKHRDNDELEAFHGKFLYSDGYDESAYARAMAESKNFPLHETEITAHDFTSLIGKVIYHLDYPVAGPGSFPQYCVSNLASQFRKVVLSGLGGDEIFGGYVRYLIAYFEQCIKGAVDDTLHNGNFIVTYDSIIPNLKILQNYKPMLKEFWREGLFDGLDERYYRLINRASNFNNEINWNEIGDYSPLEAFREIFHGSNVGKETYFDKMTHCDFKTLLPGLLHVEDRMSMAHGLESRVPFLDHPLVEFAATIPSNIKFKNGTLKKVLVDAMKQELPPAILSRKDKMGFPVPLSEWMENELKDFIMDVFQSQNAKSRPYFNTREIIAGISKEPKFGRKIWGLLSLELWHQTFVDKQHHFKQLISQTQENKI